ncbi:MAG TPA: hypothetical protein VGI64_19535 [Streptosporangiaceae bacterium]
MNIRTSIPVIMLLCALGAGVAACGGSSGKSTTPPSPSPSAPATSAAPSPSGTTSGKSAAAEITANWVAFFSPKTPVAKRVSLLENGQQFASVIKSQAGSPLASSSSAKVTKVSVTSATQAKVTYSILVGGTPALANQAGVAVLQGGTWKVGDASFCGLLILENNGKTSGLPPACQQG